MVRLIKNTDENYTNVSNQVVRDDRLSWKARGIFVYMWSQADNWNFYVSELAKHATDGEASLQSGLKELEQLGYLIRRHRQSKSGVFDGMEWVLTDHNPEKSINGKIEGNPPKKLDYPSDGKTTGWKNHPMGNRRLRNNNSKNYQQQEITTTSNRDSQAEPDHTSQARKEIIAYLNEKLKSSYRPNASKNKKLINARLHEGYSIDDFKKAIDNKIADWGNDPKMSKYLRPETLFGTKMEGYVNEKSSNQSEGASVNNKERRYW
ncbi:MAG: conserved phage C-terminal domain-containing protein [Limosilactobacillus pontis]|uniref:conserved phage C-terminal domain-containing protein n=1 Tax=Limosilactobacillus pontis TaxID=35787 RepID=UPI0039A19D7A